MGECTYRKMICSAGHESRAYAPGEPLPKHCPVCRQPYDRKIHRPVWCNADGSVPGTEETGIDQSEESVLQEPPVPVPDHHPVSEDTPVRRGRRQNVYDETETGGFRRGRTTDPARQGTVRDTDMRRSAQPRQNSGFVLYCSGRKIVIPAHGCYLGREHEGGEIFAMNLQISRKHAFAEPVRVNGSLWLRLQDAGSMNGTFADDGTGRRQLLDGEEIMLRPGNRLWLANQILVVKEDRS